MMKLIPKRVLSPWKLIAFGFVLIFLATILFCGNFNTDGSLTFLECSNAIFLLSHTNYRSVGVFSSLTFLVIALAFTVNKIRLERHALLYNETKHPIHISFETSFLAITHSHLLESFRRGILHSQIYDSTAIAG